jgi:hypothetical protein
MGRSVPLRAVIWRDIGCDGSAAAAGGAERRRAEAGGITVDQLLDRAGDLKGMLMEFGMSPRFKREFSALVERQFPDGMVTDEAEFTMVVDRFLLQHPLPAGNTVVEEFVAAHPELPEAERDMLLRWRDVVEGIFEIKDKERDAVTLLNILDELSYRARSNMGGGAFRRLKKGMFLIGRIVPLGEGWLVSGHMARIPAAMRDRLLAIAAEQAMREPEAVFRNPAKLAEARSMLAEQQKMFTDLFGSDLIVVSGSEVPGEVEKFHRRLAENAASGEPSQTPALDLPDDLLAADSVAIHFVEGEGLSFYPDYHLLEELFASPALITRRRHRETLSGFLRDPGTSPEPLRRLADRDPAKASKVFAGLLKRKRGFSWNADGEELLRQSKPRYFDGTVLPRTVPLSDPLSAAYKRAHQEGVTGRVMDQP